MSEEKLVETTPEKFGDSERLTTSKSQDSSVSIGSGNLHKTFSTFSIISIGFTLTNSWYGISASLVTGIQSGGPLLIVYGIIIVTFFSICVAITLGELSSAIPSAGGQYVWSRVLAPKKYSSFLAYLCGSFSWGGAIFTCASMASAISTELMAFWVMMHPDHVIKKWQLFIIYQIVNVFVALFNMYGKWLPHIGMASMFISIFSYTTITLTVLICSRGHYRPASFVFKEFENGTGWSSSGIAFIVGLINPAWAFSCLDSACHLAEETEKPRTDIPKALMSTVAIGFGTAFTYSIAMFFCVQNLPKILESNTGFPILSIYDQALGSRAGALCLGVLILLTSVGCTISAHTWQTRLCWSFARDNGLPFSKHLSVVDPKLGVPVKAHVFSTFWVAVLGILYLFSDVGFNSMVTGGISFLLLSYMVPVISLLYRGRNNIKRGPVWYGTLGLAANILTICWAVFALVFFSFPPTMPVTGSNMNYVSVVMAIFFILSMSYWWMPKFGCRKTFAGGLDNNEEDEFPEVCLTDL